MPQGKTMPPTRASSSSTTLADDKLEIWSDTLYQRAREEPPGTLLTQDDLLAFGIIPDLGVLSKVANKLVGEFLLQLMTVQGQTAFKCRSPDDAKIYSSVANREYRIIYELVDDAGAEGIWARSIRYRTKISELNVKNGIKWLENKGLINEFKSVEHPNKKMYIKSSLRPSERATGGPWFTNGVLDVGLLNAMEKLVFYYVKQKSTYLTRPEGGAGGTGVRAKQPTKGVLRGNAPSSKKRPAAAISKSAITVEAAPSSVSEPSTTTSSRPSGGPQRLPLPAGFTAYPNIMDVARFVNDKRVINEPLSQGDVQELVDLLIWDGRVESVRLGGGETGYRVVRPSQIPGTDNEKDGGNDDMLGVAQAPRVNGLAEVPCGCCPVFGICEPGGEVSPDKCRYYEDWLTKME